MTRCRSWVLGLSFLLSTGVFAASGDIERRYIFFMTGASEGFHLSHPEKITSDRFEQIMENFSGLPDSSVAVGLSCIFSYLQYPSNNVGQALSNFLNAAEKTGIPITVKLDGEQWWGARPDLWNWWDPSKPGYNPENAENVEWTGWGPEHAIKVSWRNWGRQVRVAPPPNLASPAYRKACENAMQPLLRIILDWRENLPSEKKNLLVAVEVGWESAIGVNHFYIEGGNELLSLPEENDPQVKLNRQKLSDRGVVLQGYAAAFTSGIRKSGRLEYEDQVEIIRRHLGGLAQFAREAGIPREMLFTHGWGNEDGELLYDAAVNKYSCPGWSSYWYSNRLAEDRGITRGIEKSNAPYWAATEWLFLHKFEKEPFREAFEHTLFYENCKYLCFYNWGGITNSDTGDEIIQAVREVVAGHAL